MDVFCNKCNDTGYVNNEPCPVCSSPEKQQEIQIELDKIKLWRTLHIIDDSKQNDGTDITST